MEPQGLTPPMTGLRSGRFQSWADALENTMNMGFWMENAMQPGRHVLVDCGAWGEPTTQERFKRLRERVALRNCERVGNDRLVVRLPPKVAPKVLAEMPEIQPGANGYCWCTHGFVQPNTELKDGHEENRDSTGCRWRSLTEAPFEWRDVPTVKDEK